MFITAFSHRKFFKPPSSISVFGESMKVDELLKHLENIKIDEDERREIAEYIIQTFGDKGMRYFFYVMMKDKTVYDYGTYRYLLKTNKISSNDAYVYIENDHLSRYEPASYLYPFLMCLTCFTNAYLTKLGSSSYDIEPAPGLKYVAIVYKSPDLNRIAIEVADIDNVITNTHLPPFKRNVLGTKHIDDNNTKEIISQLISQKLFAGHTFVEAQDIIREYYENHDASLAKEVEAIRDAYKHIFQPYRVVFDLKTKRPISSNKW